MAGFPGIAHIAITITDHERALAFYTKLFGSPPVVFLPRATCRARGWFLQACPKCHCKVDQPHGVTEIHAVGVLGESGKVSRSCLRRAK